MSEARAVRIRAPAPVLLAMSLMLVTAGAGCGSSSPPPSSGTDERPSRPERLADHRTEPEAAGTTTIDSAPYEGETAEPPPVEPPFDHAGTR